MGLLQIAYRTPEHLQNSRSQIMEPQKIPPYVILFFLRNLKLQIMSLIWQNKTDCAGITDKNVFWQKE
jgi:hypothetical protein